MKQCKYKNFYPFGATAYFECQEKAFQGSDFCALHTPFPAHPFPELEKAKNDLVVERINQRDFDFSGVYLKELNLLDLVGFEGVIRDLLLWDTKIQDRLTLSTLKIEGDTVVIDSDLGTVYLEHSCFNGDLEFRGCKMNYSDLRNVTVVGNLEFVSTRTEDHLRIDGGDIKKDLTFKNSEMKKHCLDNLKMGGCIFYENVVIDDDLVFSSANLKGLHLNSVSAKGDVLFDSAEIKEDLECKFVTVGRNLNFRNTKLHSDVRLEGIAVAERVLSGEAVFLNKDKVKKLQNQIHLYQQSVIFCSRNGYREDADMHFLKEMQARRKSKPCFSQCFDFLMEKLCGYGTDWTLAVRWWSGIILVFSAIYFVLSFYGNSGIKIASQEGPIEMSNALFLLMNSLYFSVITITTLGYGDIHPIGIAKLFASLEAIIGTFFWAMLIMVVGRKYMR